MFYEAANVLLSRIRGSQNSNAGEWTSPSGEDQSGRRAPCDCWHIAGCRKRRLSWDVQAVYGRRRPQPRRPPLAKAGETSTDDQSRHGSYGVYQDRSGEMSVGAVRHEMENLGDIERLTRRNAGQCDEIRGE